MSCRTLHTKLGTIEYSSIGKGEPILFIHGGHSNCRERLCHKGIDAEKYTLITPSRPGYGETPLSTHKTPKQTADLFIELLNELDIEMTIVYGISAGGLTAISLASSYPDRITKLILASAITKKWMDKKSAQYRMAKLMFHPKMESVTWALVRIFSSIDPKLLAKSFHAQFSAKSLNRLGKDEIKELTETLKKYRSKEGFLNDIDQTIPSEALSNIRCPTLIVHSEHDNSAPFEHAQYAHEKIPNSTLERLQNDWGHLFWLGKDSQQTIDRIVDFIKDDTTNY